MINEYWFGKDMEGTRDISRDISGQIMRNFTELLSCMSSLYVSDNFFNPTWSYTSRFAHNNIEELKNMFI
jgi:hypothetical protein